MIEFWFGDWDDHAPLGEDDPQLKRWWGGSAQLDTTMRQRFQQAHLEAAHLVAPRPTTAAEAIERILLLDQVPRNIYRGTPHAFATDGLARSTLAGAREDGLFEAMPPIWQYFALMPLMHSESLSDHDDAVEAFGTLVARTATLARAANYRNALDYEHRHRDIIVRFGRYPHRNAILGRTSTDEEAAFLTQPGSSF